MAITEERNEFARMLLCFAQLFARAGPDPPIPKGMVLRFTVEKNGEEMIIEMAEVNPITITGNAPNGEEINVSADDFDQIRIELDFPAQINALQLLECAAG